MKVLSFKDLKEKKGIPWSRVHTYRLERDGRHQSVSPVIAVGSTRPGSSVRIKGRTRSWTRRLKQDWKIPKTKLRTEL